MPDNHVDFVFGAKVADLLSGVTQVRKSIEGLREPVDNVIKDFKKIGETIGVTFVVDKLSEFANKMAEIGEHAVNMGYALGVTAAQFQTLSEQFRLVGGNADTLVRTFRQLEQASITAAANPLSRQSDAFDALNINVKEFERLDGIGKIEALQKAFDHLKATGGDLSVSGPFGILFGRSGVDALKLLNEGLDETRKKIEGTHPPSDEMLTKLAGMAQKIHLASVAFENLGATIGTALTPPLDRILDLTTQFVSNITEALEKLEKYNDQKLREAFEKQGIPVNPEGRADLPPLSSGSHQSARDNFSRNNFGNIRSAGGGWQSYPDVESGIRAIGDWLIRSQDQHGTDTLRKIIERYAPASDNPGKDLLGAAAKSTGFDPDSILDVRNAATRKKLVDALLKQEGAPSVAFDASNRVYGAGEIQGPPAPPGMRNSAEDKKTLDETLKNIKEAANLEVAGLEQKKALQEHDRQSQFTIDQQIAEAKKRSIEQQKAAVEDMGKTNKKVADEAKINNAEITKADTEVIKAKTKLSDAEVALQILADQGRVKVLDLQEQTDLKANQHKAELNQQTYEQAAENEKNIVEAHRSAVDAILADEMRLAGDRQNLAQEVTNRATELAQKSADQVTQINEKLETENYKTWKNIADNIASSMSSSIIGVIKGTETIGQAFTKLGENILEHVLTKGLTNNLESLAGSLFSGLAGGAGGGSGGILGGIGSLFGGGAGSGIGGWLSSLLADAPEAAAILAFAGGGVVPSARGGWRVPSFASGGMMAKLHSDEMVLPKHLSDGVQNAINGGSFGGGGGLTMNFHGPSDGASIKRWVGDTLRQNPNYVSDLFRRNAITPRNS